VSGELEVREATDDDLPQILELLQASLLWVPDEQYAAFYRWKHQENPFGRSPAWLALDGKHVVGLRIWLRWRFRERGRLWEVVRAVDTATHPDHQGRGIFRRLTTESLDILEQAGVDFVFNTPNENSRPGYLKMGWRQIGRLQVAARFRSPVAAARALRARVPAEKWSTPTEVGEPALRVLDDDRRVQELVDALPDDRIRTDLDVSVLRWRYGFPPLHYRAVREDQGLVFFRLRRRGPSIECVIGHVLASDRAVASRLVRRAARISSADQVLELTNRPHLRAGFLPLPGAGPILTWRAVRSQVEPERDRWNLAMGDVELF
jgi:GNAT superfamily N-acetyltransferase